MAHPTGLMGRTGQTVQLTVAPNEVASGLFPLIIESISNDSNAIHFWIGAIVRK
jgi:hypothetical protein